MKTVSNYINGQWSRGSSSRQAVINPATQEVLAEVSLSGAEEVGLAVEAAHAAFPFSGWKNSFFGDLHGQGRDGVEFHTEKRVVVERWAKEHSRKL